MEQVRSLKTVFSPQDPMLTRSIGPADTCALFLDVDGTILDIAETPDAVQVDDHLRAVLRHLQVNLGGALALVSGRPIADLDRLFEPLHLPIAGLHGLERRAADGVIHRIDGAAGLDNLRSPLQIFAAARPGLVLEDKKLTLALHYRQAPTAETEARAFVEELVAGCRGLEVLHGKMVLEIKPRQADKGAAILAFMNEPPYLGRKPVFIGDDVTDEDGFAIVNRMDGFSVRVGTEKKTAARYHLSDVAAVTAWLGELYEVLDGDLDGDIDRGHGRTV